MKRIQKQLVRFANSRRSSTCGRSVGLSVLHTSSSNLRREKNESFGYLIARIVLQPFVQYHYLSGRKRWDIQKFQYQQHMLSRKFAVASIAQNITKDSKKYGKTREVYVSNWSGSLIGWLETL